MPLPAIPECPKCRAVVTPGAIDSQSWWCPACNAHVEPHWRKRKLITRRSLLYLLPFLPQVPQALYYSRELLRTSKTAGDVVVTPMTAHIRITGKAPTVSGSGSFTMRDGVDVKVTSLLRLPSERAGKTFGERQIPLPMKNSFGRLRWLQRQFPKAPEKWLSAA